MFERIAILDVGGAAARCVQTVRTMGIATADPRALIAGREARPREAVEGETPEPDGSVLQWGRHSHPERRGGLDVTELCSWLERTGADAAWVGWGAPNGHRSIAEACETVGVAFVGPGVAALAAIRDPATLQRRMTAAGLRMAAGSDRATPTTIEVQLLVDERGAAWTVGVVVHTTRGGRPVLSTTAQGALDDAQLATCEQVAVTAARALELRGAVAIELNSPSHRDPPSIRRVRPHLTPTHTLSEVTTGLDLVARQFELAAGSHLMGSPHSRPLHAASATLRVDELPTGSSATTPVEWLEAPSSPGLRCDAAVEQGDVIPAALGTELVTFTTTGQDRGHALARLSRTMERCTVALRAGATDRGSPLDALLELGATPFMPAKTTPRRRRRPPSSDSPSPPSWRPSSSTRRS